MAHSKTNMLVQQFLAATAALSLASAAEAGDIYTWKDATGRVQMSDVVPDKYKRTATRIDPRRFELTSQQRATAQALAAALKARANTEAASPEPAERRRVAASSAASSVTGKQAADLSDCASWRRAFVASRDCYAGYPAVNGNRRPGAMEACGPDIPNPDPKCGPEKWQ